MQVAARTPSLLKANKQNRLHLTLPPCLISTKVRSHDLVIAIVVQRDGHHCKHEQHQHRQQQQQHRGSSQTACPISFRDRGIGLHPVYSPLGDGPIGLHAIGTDAKISSQIGAIYFIPSRTVPSRSWPSPKE
jgi:hypothetical protein